MNDIEVILKALTREREDLHQQLMQIDRIIKRVKTGTYSDEPVIEAIPVKQLKAEGMGNKPRTLSPILDLKVQVLKAFDVLNVASTLKQLQTEFTALTNNKVNIRETVRSLQKSTLIKLIKDKTSSRGFMWAKTEWLEGGQLADNHKPDGFDMLYRPENLIYE